MIKLNGISKQYSNGKETIYGLNEINLILPEQGMVFIVGKSGSGKSTLLNIIGALDEATSGELFFKNSLINQHNKNQYLFDHISFIFQEHNLINDLSAQSNIDFTKSIVDIQSSNVSTILNSIDLVDMEDRQPKAMSTGQKQRVSIARALHKNSSVILADEPTGSLDSENSIDVMKILKRLSKDKLVVCVTHEDALAEEFSDRIIRMKDGKIISDTDDETLTKDSLVWNNEFVPKEHFLTLKQMIILAVNNIKRKPIRILFTLLLASLSLSFFGLMTSFSSYDYVETLERSLAADDDNYIQITQESVVKNDDTELIYDDGFSVEEISTLSEIIDSASLIYVSNLIKGDLDNYMYYDYSGIYNTRISNNVAINADIAAKLNITLLSGNYPVNEQDVVLSKHIYNLLSESGVKDSNNMLIEVESYEDLLNYEIMFNDVTYKIVGIIDTNFNESIYEPLKTQIDTNDFYNNYLLQQLNDEMQNGLQNFLFVHPDVISNAVDTLSSPYIDLSIQGSNLELFYAYPENDLLNGKSISYTTVSWDCENLLLDVAYKDMLYTDNDLCDNESDIVIPASSIRHAITDNDLNVIEFYNQKSRELVMDFAVSHFDEIKDVFDIIPLKEDTYYDYYEYILDTSTNDNQLNEYHANMEFDFFKEQAFNETVTLYLPYLDDTVVYLDNNGTTINESVNVVGMINDLNTDYSRTIYTSVTLGESTKSIVNSAISKIIVLDDQDEGTSSIISGRKMLKQSSKVIVESNIAFFLTYFGDYINSITSISSAIALFMIFVLGVLLFNLISSSILDRQYEIGVIKAIGISNKGISLLFLVESFIISLINSVFAIILFVVLSIYANSLFNFSDMNQIIFFPITLLSILLIIGISLLITIISTILPILSVSKKNITELMKHS